MAVDVAEFIKTCMSCQRNKPSVRTPVPPSPLPVPTAQWQSISMDLMTDLPETPEGYTAIFVVVCRLTKLVKCMPCRKEVTAAELADLFMRHCVLKGLGLPRSIVCDRDPRFRSQFWTELLHLLGTKLKLSTAFHPQTDGQTEVYNKVLQQVLRNYCGASQADWFDLLPFAEFVINNTTHSTTAHTPFFLTQGWHPRTPLNWSQPEPETVPKLSEWFARQRAAVHLVQQLLQEANQKIISKAHAGTASFLVGEKVLLSTKNLKFKSGSKKLHPAFCGPFSVKRVIKNVACELELPKEMGKTHPVFHNSLLKPFYSSDRHVQPPPPLLVEEDIFQVDTVLKHRKRRGSTKKNRQGQAKNKGKPKFELLVSWQGFGPEYNSWVKEEWVLDKSVLTEYWKTHPKEPQEQPPAKKTRKS